MNNKARIGISCARQPDGGVFLRDEYARAVAQAGGIPLLLPQLDDHYIGDQLSAIDGIIFSGGPDYDAGLFAQANHPAVNRMDEIRERHDRRLFAVAREWQLPILAVCAGCQLAAIHFGAAIIQDIPDLVRNARQHKAGFDDMAHALHIHPDSQLRRLMRVRHPHVNSAHHQSVDPESLPEGLLISASSDDGVVEAFEIIPGSALDNGAWFLATQWHPEHLIHDPDNLALFRQLVQQAVPADRAIQAQYNH